MTTEDQEYFDDFDNLFFSDGYRLANESLKNEINNESLLDMSRKVFDYISNFHESPFYIWLIGRKLKEL